MINHKKSCIVGSLIIKDCLTKIIHEIFLFSVIIKSKDENKTKIKNKIHQTKRIKPKHALVPLLLFPHNYNRKPPKETKSSWL